MRIDLDYGSCALMARCVVFAEEHVDVPDCASAHEGFKWTMEWTEWMDSKWKEWKGMEWNGMEWKWKEMPRRSG